MPTMRGFLAGVAGALVLAMTAGCGEDRAGDPGGSDRDRTGASDEHVHSRAGSAGVRMALDCPTNLRGSGTWEDWNGIEGDSSPAAVARPFVYEPAGESLTVTKNRYGAQAWILRADETARAVLNVSYKADYGGWYLTTYETCADMPLTLGTGTLPPVHGYTLDPPSGQTPTVTEAEAIEAAHQFGLSKYAQLRAAAVRSVYASGYGETFDHHDLWVLASDVMVPKWGYAHPPGFNKPNNPPVPGTAVAFVDPQTGKVPRALSW
jgi:hypothetical protein